MKTDKQQAEDQARAQVESIVTLMEALETARECGEVLLEGYDYDEEGMRERIRENALSVEVRRSWYSPGTEDKPDQFCILLCTGGPAVRIVGDLGKYCQPTSARVQFQDWGTPWTEWFDITSTQREHVIAYCRTHWFGE